MAVYVNSDFVTLNFLLEHYVNSACKFSYMYVYSDLVFSWNIIIKLK